MSALPILSADVAVIDDSTGESSPRLSELEAEARHASERFGLYRAKAYGPRLTSPGRLRELERGSKFAERRLQRARAEQGAHSAPR